MFAIVALLVWTGLNLYVLWRASSVPFIEHNVPRGVIWGAGAFLFFAYILGRVLTRFHVPEIAGIVEWIGANWIGMLFFLFVCFLSVDLISGFGFLFRNQIPSLRTGALFAASLLSAIALFQAIRPPVVRNYEVRLAGLSPERDGTVMVVASDLHVGEVLRDSWLRARVAQINALKPDIIVLAGDIVEGHNSAERDIVPTLKTLKAPQGVWAVTGNHEYYGGLEQCVRLLESAGIHVLRDKWAEAAPGLVLAGVDDLTARRQFGDKDDFVNRALAGRPPSAATVLLSHTPWEADKAESAGTGLMLSGHTHNGQIWPFGYLVKLRYPYFAGRYEVGRMSLIVCRGTGIWGPRMRLWMPSEILRITLRTEKA